jgi:hypothetical protein
VTRQWSRSRRVSGNRLDDFDLPLSRLEEELAEWAAEALRLRFAEVAGSPAVELPPVESGASEVMQRLLAVRQRLDRVEELLARATRARGRSSRAAQVAKAQADDAWDVSSQRGRAAPVRRGGEFEGPRERYADNNLATLDQRRATREAERLADSASECLDVVRLCHRGLDGIRQDLLTMLRAFQFESHLER